MMRNTQRRGFTLIELITVIAISTILLSLIAIPVVQAFNLTRAAQGFAQAQDKARTLIDRISREISNSAGVRDNSGTQGTLQIVLPGLNGNPEPVTLQNVKLDIFKPAEGEENIDPTAPGVLVNPDINKIDPTLKTTKGQTTLPVAEGSTLIRYFIGLRRPFNIAGNPLGYNNGYDGLLMARNADEDNLYVLWRAEIPWRVFNNAANPPRWQVNPAYFYDFNGDGQINEDDMDDPAFFVPGLSAAHDAILKNWLNKATIVTEVNRFDMIQPVFDKATQKVVYDLNAANVQNVPRVIPLIQFLPQRVSSEPAEGQTAVRPGEETNNEAKVGPDVLKTKYGGWTSLFIRAWPSVIYRNPGTGVVEQSWLTYAPWVPNTPYMVGRPRVVAGKGVGFSLFGFDGLGNEALDGYELFDVAAYYEARGLDRRQTPASPIEAYPFSYAIDVANNRPGGSGNGWLSGPNSVALREVFIGFVPEPRKGKITASFGIDEVGDGNPALPRRASDNKPLFDNRPSMLTGPALTPNNDPNLNVGNWFDAQYQTVNRRFNKLWFDWATLVPGIDASKYCKRFIDLRVTPQWDGAPSPLDPVNGFFRAKIVPGSDIVIGPDQNPGPNYGRPVRYTRVSQRPVGPNQYLINYVNQKEPDWTVLGLPLPANYTDPRTYVANNFVSAILQPQYRAGYIELNSRYGEPIPDGYNDAVLGPQPGNISVFYRFQFTEPNDVFAADYDTRQIMGINLTIRNYPQTNLPNPQSISLKGSATVRNFIR